MKWQLAQNMNAKTFVQIYLDAEYDLRAMAHAELNNERFSTALEVFDAAFLDQRYIG